jgi:hypothetical protein
MLCGVYWVLFCVTMPVTNCADTRRCRHVARRNSCAEVVSYFCGSNMLIPTAPPPPPISGVLVGRLPFVYSFILEVCGRGPHCYTTLLLGVGKATVLYLMMVHLLHRFQCLCSNGRAEGGFLRRTCRNMVYPALLPQMRTPRLPLVYWTNVLRRFKWTLPFRRKTKYGFCACAMTFQTQSTTVRWRRDVTRGRCGGGGALDVLSWLLFVCALSQELILVY